VTSAPLANVNLRRRDDVVGGNFGREDRQALQRTAAAAASSERKHFGLEHTTARKELGPKET